MEKAEDVYKRVVEKFPEINEEEIKIKHVTNNLYAYITLIDSRTYYLTKEIVRRPIILIGSPFYNLSNREKEAVIAHELGHYMLYRNCNPERLKRYVNWLVKVLKNQHVTERLRKWTLIHELYADNYAAKIGYREELLPFLKKIYADLNSKNGRTRIKNLEKILETKDNLP